MRKTISKETFLAFQSGDGAAFGEITLVYYAKVKVFVRYVIKIEMDVEEITQDVFLKFWENRQKVFSPEAINSYLFRLSLNESFSYIRRSKRQKTIFYTDFIDDDQLDRMNINTSSSDPEMEYIAKELELELKMRVREMPKQRREIFIMSRQNGLTNLEIAQKLNISVRTVESHIYSALNEIRGVIETIGVITLYLTTI